MSNFERNFDLLKRDTYEIDNIPEFPAFAHRWHLIHTDALLTLLKYFKKKYKLKGNVEKTKRFVDQVGASKNVRASSVYSPYKILRKTVVYEKWKNPERPARVFQYNNKFFPIDREDLHIMAVNLIMREKLLGPCIVVNLTGADKKEIGNPLGDQQRMERVYKFLGIPDPGNPNAEHEKDFDADGNKLTDKQKDLFNNPPDGESIDIGFKTPEEADASIQALTGVDDKSHQVKATLLMIQRAKAALARVKDPEKRANIEKSLRKYLAFKQKVIDKERTKNRTDN